MTRRAMSSRERLLAALNHEEPDRVPIDLGGGQSGIHRLAYRDLLDHLDLDEEIVVTDVVQQLAQPSEAVLERLRVDTRYIMAGPGTGFRGELVRAEREGRTYLDLTDEFGVRWSMDEGAPRHMTISLHPLAEAGLAGCEGHPFPRGDDPCRFAGLRERAREIREHTPYAVVSGIAGSIYEVCWRLRGLEQWYGDMLAEPELCAALLDRVLVYWLDWFRSFLDEVGDLVDVVMIGDDLAGQGGPLFRPAFYREVVQPRHRRLVRYLRSRTRARICYHSCGGCAVFIPDLLDNGVDVLNPVQIGAVGMDPAQLKERFGDRLAFWGGAIDSQQVLPVASPEEIREDVRRRLEVWKPGGGYVFGTVDDVQPGVPAENVVGLFDAAFEFGSYA